MRQMLDIEPQKNPSFRYKGSFVGLIGNVQAAQIRERFVESDLNRLLTPDNYKYVIQTPCEDLEFEWLEFRQLILTIQGLIDELNPTKVIILDLHTTSSDGGIFTLPNEMPESLAIATELHAPVVLGMMDGIQGTTLHFFHEGIFGIDTVPITFEAGQHLDPISIKRAISAITNCMRTIGSVDPRHVEHQHDEILIEYSKNLPRVSRLMAKYKIKEGENFVMRPGYKNFQKIKKGELLAHNDQGPILASHDGLLLMPLYQSKGEDGFFIIEELTENIHPLEYSAGAGSI